MKGFDHESELSPYARPEYDVHPGIYDQTPTLLLALLEDEALEKEDVTFCIWRETTDTKWRMGDVQTSEKKVMALNFCSVQFLKNQKTM